MNAHSMEVILHQPASIKLFSEETVKAESIVGCNNIGIFVNSAEPSPEKMTLFFIPFSSILWIGYGLEWTG